MLKEPQRHRRLTREALALPSNAPSARTGSSPASNAWSPSAGHRSMSASTTARVHRVRRWPTSATPTGTSLGLFDHHGRTPAARASMADAAASTSTANSSTQPPRSPSGHRRLANRMQLETHSAHGWLTPVEFVDQWLHDNRFSSHKRLNDRGWSLSVVICRNNWKLSTSRAVDVVARSRNGLTGQARTPSVPVRGVRAKIMRISRYSVGTSPTQWTCETGTNAPRGALGPRLVRQSHKGRLHLRNWKGSSLNVSAKALSCRSS
jgi:hypothetical protein